MEECAEFRRQKGRRWGPQKEEEEMKMKKKGWEVMICCGDDESDESDSMRRKQYDQFPEERGPALTGMGGVGAGAAMDQLTEERVGSSKEMEGSDAGAVIDSKTIPTPSWRKIGGFDSDASNASTYIADGKMGRSRPVRSMPRGIYAMGAPRTNMSHCMTTWDCDSEVKSSGLEEMGEVSRCCY